jgi:hypothetical protein
MLNSGHAIEIFRHRVGFVFSGGSDLFFYEATGIRCDMERARSRLPSARLEEKDALNSGFVAPDRAKQTKVYCKQWSFPQPVASWLALGV